MNIGNQKIGYFIIILAAIILAAVIYFVFYFDFGGQKTTTTEDGNTVPVEDIISSEPTNQEPQPPMTLKREQLSLQPQQLASAFVERFGSFSNQAEQNLSELDLFMTADLQTWARSHPQTTADYNQYYGMTTIAVSSTIQDQSATAVSILVHAARRETKVDQVKNFNQDALVELVKVGSKWKVNAIYWK
jgi:hypothetical protein